MRPSAVCGRGTLVILACLETANDPKGASVPRRGHTSFPNGTVRVNRTSSPLPLTRFDIEMMELRD
jgi:hypothetical protein